MTRAVEAARAVDGLGQRLLHLLGHEHRVHLALPEGVPRAAAGSTRATARRSGARAAAPRSPSTSRPARRTTASSSTRRSTSASRSGDRDGESLVVWTTTPWTLPANVAAAVQARRGVRAPRRRLAAAPSEGGELRQRRSSGEELVGLEYDGPFDDLPAQEGVRHRVIPWDEVALDEGTGIVHIAPGAGAEDFELSRVHDLPVLAPIDESGRFLPGYGPFEGLTTDECGAGDHRGAATSAACSSRPARSSTATRSAGAARRRSSSASSTTGSSPRRGPAPAAARRERRGRVDAAATTRSGWTTGCATWATGTSRASATSGCRCPSTRATCGELNVIGSRAELEERATGGLEQLQELHRPWIDEVPIRCESCNEEVRRIPEVGDAWLDAGIVPFSTLGWENPRVGRARLRDRRGGGPDRRRPARPRLLGAVVPGRLGLGEPRADPALVLLDQRHGDDARRAGCRTARVLDLRARARRDRPRDAQVDRQRDRGERGVRADGRRHRALAVLRAEPEPEHQLRLRARGRGQAAAADALELGHRSSSRTRTSPAGSRSGGPSRPSRARRSTAGCVARTTQLVAEAEAAYERYWTPAVTTAFESYVEDLSNWYIRRSRPPLLGRRPDGARDALVVARPGAARDRAGDAVPRRPPLAGARRLRRAGLGRTSPAGRRSASRTRRCSPRWRRCAASSSSANRRARSRG